MSHLSQVGAGAELESYSNPAVVIDNGTGLLKAGISGSELPKTIFTPYIGRPKHQRVITDTHTETQYIGDRAREYRGICQLQYAMQHGTVQNWDDMLTVWNYTYSQLNVQSNEHPLLLTECINNPISHKIKACELLYETLNVPALYVAIQSILALYSSGRTTGVVVDSGAGHTSVTPVFEGYITAHAVQRSDIGGNDVNKQLQLMLRKATGHNMMSSSEMEIVRDMKEKVCYVGIKPTMHNNNNKHNINEPALYDSRTEPDVPYKLPDGNIIQIGQAKTSAVEVLFNPLLIGNESLPVHHMLTQSIAGCDMDIRKQLYNNIVLSGGNTLFDGYGDRLLMETRALCGRDTKLKIYAAPDRLLSTWIGGSILGSLSTFKNMWISKKQYEENGQSIIYRQQNI